MKLEQLMKLTYKWSDVRGILDQATPLTQLAKTQEELDETVKATEEEDYDEMLDGVGDILVTLCNYCHLTNIDIEDAMDKAWNEIKDRKGLMIGGTFVKYENLSLSQQRMIDEADANM